MTLSHKRLVLSTAFAVAAALGFAEIEPSIAQDYSGGDSAFDPSRLVKFEGRIYEVEYEDSVSALRLSQTTVRKISFGKTRFVDIVTTATGTYSTDALFSPHVRYPGIHVTDHGKPLFLANVIGFWTEGTGWVPQQMQDAGSFLRLPEPDIRK